MQTNRVIKKRSSVRRFLTWACLFTIVAIGAYSANRLFDTADSRTGLNTALAKSPAREGQIQTMQYERKIYPYSIVRGGMRSREEVYANIRTDHAVAEHYSGFNIDETRVIQAPKSRPMYVSYRLGDEVYWTAKAINIPQGETLITDGTIEARTRCGNRLSATPMTPTSDEEPDIAFFDIPENEIPGYFEPEQSIDPEQTPMAQFEDPATPPSGGLAPRGMSPSGNNSPFLQGSPALFADSGTGGKTSFAPDVYDKHVSPNLPGAVPEQLPGTLPELPGTLPELPGTLPELPGKLSELPGKLSELPDPSTVPEPGTLVMLFTGLAAVAVVRKGRQKL